MRPAGFRSHRGHPPVFSTPASATRSLPVHMSPRDDRTAISTLGLSLVPLQVSGAEDMVGVLGDERLREFNRRAPRHDRGTADRYASLVAGSSDPDECGSTGSSAAVQTRSRSGPSQATLTTRGGRSTAKRRLVIGVD